MGDIMKTIILVCILTALPVSPRASWTDIDTGREILWQSLHVIDWGQTLDIARQPERFHEHNVLLGGHPSPRAVNNMMIWTGLAHGVVSRVLPSDARKWWQWMTIAGCAYYVMQNHKLGIKVRF